MERLSVSVYDFFPAMGKKLSGSKLRDKQWKVLSLLNRVARWFICKPKISILSQFGRPKSGKFWCILWTFGIFKVIY
jgi:hypothetical protein